MPSLFPPSPLIPDAMNRPVMDSAQRGDKFITHLPAECTRLHEAQMMGIGRFSPAYETRLFGDEPQMLFVAIATRLSDCEHALVDRQRTHRFSGLAGAASSGAVASVSRPSSDRGQARQAQPWTNSDNLSANASSTSLASAAARLFLVMISSCAQLVAFSVDCKAGDLAKKSLPQRS